MKGQQIEGNQNSGKEKPVNDLPEYKEVLLTEIDELKNTPVSKLY